MSTFVSPDKSKKVKLLAASFAVVVSIMARGGWRLFHEGWLEKRLRLLDQTAVHADEVTWVL
jgi:hypothetical protein